MQIPKDFTKTLLSLQESRWLHPHLSFWSFLNLFSKASARNKKENKKKIRLHRFRWTSSTTSCLTQIWCFSSLFRYLCGSLKRNPAVLAKIGMILKSGRSGWGKICRRCRKVLQAKLLMRGSQGMSKVANARYSLFHYQNSTLRIMSNADHLEWER